MKLNNESLSDIYLAERVLLAEPVRIQMHRKRGYNLQDESIKINGLPAVLCSRSSKFGNPFRLIEGEIHLQTKWKFKNNWMPFYDDHCNYTIKDVVNTFEKFLLNPYHISLTEETKKQLITITQNLHLLRDKNLACFCKENGCCHCDILLKLANI